MSHARSAIIVADGGIDLPEGYAERFGILMVPLMLRFGDQEYKSGVDITPAEFYSRLRNGGGKEWPSTSQPPVGDFLAVYREAAASGLPILSFHISAGLSGSYGSARLAKEMLPTADIRLVDTGTLSGAMALQVLVAANMARDGADPDAIIAETKRIGAVSEIFYTIDTLEYLRRGGRIGRVAGFVGSLLGIRPIITVDKSLGTYVGAGRGRSFRQAANSIVESIVDRVGEGNEITCLILHGDVVADAERMIANLRSKLKVHWVEAIRANPSLGAHVGPDTLGIAYYPGKLPAELGLATELVGD